MKPPKQYSATVEQQLPAQNEVAQLRVVGHVTGDHEQCWQQAKKMTRFPVITFREIKDAHHGTQC